MLHEWIDRYERLGAPRHKLLAQMRTALTVLFAAGAVGVVVLWLLGALGAARRMPFDPVADSLLRYFVAIIATFLAYYSASALVTVSKTGKSELWPYVRWILIAGATGLVFAGLMQNHELASLGRANVFLKIYVQLLGAGLLGTFVGMKETASKREMK